MPLVKHESFRPGLDPNGVIDVGEEVVAMVIELCDDGEGAADGAMVKQAIVAKRSFDLATLDRLNASSLTGGHDYFLAMCPAITTSIERAKEIADAINAGRPPGRQEAA